MSYVSMEDHKRPDGGIDWNAYQNAQVENGEKCYKCRDYASVLFGGLGYRRLCDDCKRLTSGEKEITHPKFLRCPECEHAWNPVDEDHFNVFQEGEHQVCCNICDTTFEVSTRISFSFTSRPAEKRR